MVPTGHLWLDKRHEIKGFCVGVEILQGCVLFPNFFIVYMNCIDKCNQADECAMIGICKLSCLLFADDLILLPQILVSGVALQRIVTPPE